MCRLINLLQRQLFPHLFHSHRMMYFALVAGIEFFYFLIHVSPGTSRPNRSTYFKTKQNEHLSLIKILPPSTHLLPIFISTHTPISSGQPWLLSTYVCIRTHEWAHTHTACSTDWSDMRHPAGQLCIYLCEKEADWMKMSEAENKDVIDFSKTYVWKCKTNILHAAIVKHWQVNRTTGSYMGGNLLSELIVKKGCLRRGGFLTLLTANTLQLQTLSGLGWQPPGH